MNFTKPLLRDKTLRVVTFQRLLRRVVIQSAVMENGEGQTLAWLILNLVVMLPPVDRKEHLHRVSHEPPQNHTVTDVLDAELSLIYFSI